MEDVEKFEIKIKTFVVLFLFGFISFVAFLFIGIAKVEAKSYAFEVPNLAQFRNGTATSNIETGSTLISSNSRQTFLQNLDSELLSTQFNARYSIDFNTSNNDTYFAKDDYKISLRFRVAFFSDSSKTINVNQIRLWFYRPTTKAYRTMTCDGDQSFNYTKMSSVDYIIEYECSSLTFTHDDITWVAYSYYNPSPMTLWQNSQNMYLISTSESATNNDIITNNNQNTDSIINNQNQNTQDIINSNNANADKIVDTLEGEDLTDSEKESVNKDELNDYESSEDALLNEDRLNSINDIDISIDSNTNDFIWDFITSVINTHSRIFGFIITILSIGIIKLALNR